MRHAFRPTFFMRENLFSKIYRKKTNIIFDIRKTD